MITNQESPQAIFRPLRSNHYNIPRNDGTTDLDKPLKIYKPRPKLVFIERSLQKLADNTPTSPIGW